MYKCFIVLQPWKPMIQPPLLFLQEVTIRHALLAAQHMWLDVWSHTSINHVATK